MIKPKIFVSSTVLDFEDLRSSLKFYLEEYGYDVQMSEYPNFNVDTDGSAFDACIKNLENCQYFILIIGFRRGSWYVDNKISITHQEYLSAKALIEKGHPLRIIAFVRKTTWMLKNDRKELVQYLENKSKELSKIIVNTGTTIIDDPEYIFNFIEDITSGIVFPGSESPANNWIYDFNSFEDIIIALRNTFGINENLEIKKIRNLFIRELKSNINKFLIPKDGVKIEDYKNPADIPKENLLKIIAKKYGIKFINKDGKSLIGIDKIKINGSDIGEIFLFTQMLPSQLGFNKLNNSILKKIIIEGIYLTFDINKNDYSTNLLTYALDKLDDWIDKFKEFFNSDLYKRDFSRDMAILSTDGSSHLPEISIPMSVAGTLLMFSRNYRIKNLLECILELIEENNIDPLKNFNFSDTDIFKFMKAE